MPTSRTAKRVHDLPAVAQRLGFDPQRTAAAAETAAASPQFAFTGWLASGKDCVADAVYELLAVPAVKSSLATPLKEEVTDLMRVASDAFGYRGAIHDVAAGFSVPRRSAERVIDMLVGERRSFEDAREDLRSEWNGWTRTPQVRRALQYWGTDVRRAQDPSYWVDRALVRIIDALADGEVPYFCDCRFPDEVEALQSVGYTVVRLEVTRETQRDRLFERDGIEPDPAALRHSSETALDNYEGFDVVIDNNGTLEEAVAAVMDVTD